MADPFDNIRKKSGIEIWRIENFLPVLIPENDHGKFYIQDCYVILKTTGSGGYPTYNVHFWLGSQASKDKIGASAMYAQHLYSKVGAALQFRELQNEESKKFKSYFQNLSYLPGGTESGFKRTNMKKLDENIIDKKLYKIIQETDWKRSKIDYDLRSIQEKGLYILDAHSQIYVYLNDPTCSTFARTKARVLANEVKITKKNAQMLIIDENSSATDINNFFQEFRYKYIVLDEKTQQKGNLLPDKPEQGRKIWKIVAVFLIILGILLLLLHPEVPVGLQYIEDWYQNLKQIGQPYLQKISTFIKS